MRTFVSKLGTKMDEYLNFRQAMGRSDYHKRTLKNFDKFCFEQYPEIKIPIREVVLDWFARESAKNQSGITLESKATAIRQFARYVGEEAYVLPDKFTPVKKRLFTPYIFTDVELTLLLTTADAFPSKFQHDPLLLKVIPVILRLLYTCGLRPGEARMIKCKNINFSTGEVLISQTKTRKERIIVMSNDMLEMCKSYEFQRNLIVGEKEYFFTNKNGNVINCRQIETAIKRCWIIANPETKPNMLPKIRPYDLRHQFASAVLHKWLDEGRNLYTMLPYLRTYMGHKDMSTTAYYIHILPEKLLKSSGIDWDKIDNVLPEVKIWER